MDNYDLIIIGGGSAGLGVALASCNLKDKKVLLIEKEKLSSKTSNSSLRIIHGGLRYLQKLDLIRVAESLHAQSHLLKKYPEHIEKLSCVMPLNKFGLKSRYPMTCASILYNIISILITGKSNGAYVGKISDYKDEIDIIKNKDDYALFWNDAILKSPLNFAKALKFELIKSGIKIIEDEKVINIEKNGDVFLLTTLTDAGEKREFKSKYVINAAGPWFEKIPNNISHENSKKYKWCKAFNIILNEKASFKEAVGVFGEDNRAFFIVPRDGYICVGTWYVPYEGDLKDITPTHDEVEAFMSSFNKVDLNIKISKDNIRELEAGILPMKSVGNAGPVLYGLEKISNNNNYVKILSTKYTTFVAQGEKAIRKIF